VCDKYVCLIYVRLTFVYIVCQMVYVHSECVICNHMYKVQRCEWCAVVMCVIYIYVRYMYG